MNTNAQAISAYRMSASQVPPKVAVVRLFDEALRRIRLTIVATRDKDFEGAYANLNRATQILRGLTGILRPDASPEMVDLLRNAYLQNMMGLHSAFGKKDADERYVRIMYNLVTLRNSWAVVAEMDEINPDYNLLLSNQT